MEIHRAWVVVYILVEKNIYTNDLNPGGPGQALFPLYLKAVQSIMHGIHTQTVQLRNETF